MFARDQSNLFLVTARIVRKMRIYFKSNAFFISYL